MTKYQDWMNNQSPEFQRTVLGDKEVTKHFRDLNYKRITLSELVLLDQQFCLEGSESHNNKVGD